MSTRDSPGGKGGRCLRLTTYHPFSAERQEIRGLNLPGPPLGHLDGLLWERPLPLPLYLIMLHIYSLQTSELYAVTTTFQQQHTFYSTTIDSFM